jgi:arylsulfatase A-like enzyme
MAEGHSGRNILFVMTDQQRYDSLGCNGGSIARTPVNAVERLVNPLICWTFERGVFTVLARSAWAWRSMEAATR